MSRGGRALLPYGNLPRLLLAWICTDTVRTKSRRLELGASLSEFMDRLNIQSTDSGGRYGVRTRLQKQMIRLFSASISLSERHERGARGVNAPIVDTYDLCGTTTSRARPACGTATSSSANGSSRRSWAARSRST